MGSHVASPVCLPPRRDDPVNTQCIVMGWGKIEGGKNANHLRERTVTKVERRTFGHKASEEGMFYEVDEPTTCGGDAGGPLLCPVEGNEEVLLQFGIIAWFYDTDTPVGDDCTGGGASFSNVAPFIAWIKKIADE
ncbi:PREDICTED: chymotrypsinogen B-like [Rhagoletis zephyria]|uniref:chymotrypsinogen B-like n=1 Tax=Rhagoletis zephyria TaxID=28612 RepID=UPI0008119710|nr:PREDICTED: chymotrypsinogen B-like [Rhagoletis zephyria]